MTRPFSSVLRYLRGAVSAKDGGALTDAQLLQSFVDHHDAEAFETLVRRHGPAVLGVCRRVLHQQQDAEDAFQATFLVLARKAASIVSQATVGNWLYGVAYRTARKAKVTNARRRNREAQAATMPQHEHNTDEVWHDLQPLLDQELHRLPAKYRSPIMLCDLEGKTRPEAARQLGWPEGTLSWRLASARTMLAKRLRRRGLALSAGSLALVLSQQASASLSAPLVLSTVKAATLSPLGQAVAAGLISVDVAALTEGVLRTMFYTKLKIAGAVCLAVAVMGAGVGVVSYGALAAPADRAPATDQADRDGQNRVAAADGERGGEPKNAADVSGRITAISADGKVLTVQTGGGGRGEEPQFTEVKLTDKTKIEFNGVGKDLNRKLKVGDTVAVSLQGGSAGLVQATAAPDVAGKITAVSGDGKAFTVETSAGGRNGDEPKTVEIKITDKTQMLKAASRGGEEVQPEKPAVGHSASVWLVDGSKDTAAAVDIRKPSPLGERGERR
jgi:RNA polymerase sigma factor (sigma-70 family)